MKERPKPMGFWQYDESQPTFNANSGPSAWIDNRYKLRAAESPRRGLPRQGDQRAEKAGGQIAGPQSA